MIKTTHRKVMLELIWLKFVFSLISSKYQIDIFFSMTRMQRFQSFYVISEIFKHNKEQYIETNNFVYKNDCLYLEFSKFYRSDHHRRIHNCYIKIWQILAKWGIPQMKKCKCIKYLNEIKDFWGHFYDKNF